MFSKHIARIDDKTFCFSIWNLDKMLPTKIFVGGKSKARKMYRGCALMDVDMFEFTKFESTDLKNKLSPSVKTLPLNRRTKREDMTMKQKARANELVDFLIEQ